jgi:hypothetical protein
MPSLSSGARLVGTSTIRAHRGDPPHDVGLHDPGAGVCHLEPVVPLGRLPSTLLGDESELASRVDPDGRVLTQAIANEPELEWGTGRFTPLFPKLMRLLAAAYPLRT